MLLILLLASSPAAADFLDGNDLVTSCGTIPNSRPGFCLGYIAGVYDGYRYGEFVTNFDLLAKGSNDGFNGLPDKFCPPDRVTIGQVTEIAMRHIEKNPQDRHKAASVIVLDALVDAFPCPER